MEHPPPRLEITPGPPPVRGARRRRLLDRDVEQELLHKALTPIPMERKPPGHEREFFKPPSPLLTNEVTPGAPPVRAEKVETPFEDGWFDSFDGTLEPARERTALPPRRTAWAIAALAAIGAAIGLVAGLVQSSSAPPAAATAAVGQALPSDLTVPVGQALPSDLTAPVGQPSRVASTIPAPVAEPSAPAVEPTPADAPMEQASRPPSPISAPDPGWGSLTEPAPAEAPAPEVPTAAPSKGPNLWKHLE